VKRILLTGMSGVGKSTIVEELNRRGFVAVDLDTPAWSDYRELDGAAKRVVGGTSGEDWLWREDRVRDLLEGSEAEILFVAGCAPNQGRFYPHFDHVVLLTAPAEVTIRRLATRTNNAFGKRPEELAKVLADKQRFEAVLRQGADHEVDASAQLGAVLDEVLDLAVSR
jgi:dephospho-CoA kinase